MKQGNFENEEFIRVGTTLYKLVNQPRLNGVNRENYLEFV